MLASDRLAAAMMRMNDKECTEYESWTVPEQQFARWQAQYNEFGHMYHSAIERCKDLNLVPCMDTEKDVVDRFEYHLKDLRSRLPWGNDQKEVDRRTEVARVACWCNDLYEAVAFPLYIRTDRGYLQHGLIGYRSEGTIRSAEYPLHKFVPDGEREIRTRVKPIRSRWCCCWSRVRLGEEVVEEPRESDQLVVFPGVR